MNAFDPSPALLTKLGSLIVHADEFMSDDGHQFDLAAFRTLMEDGEVMEWLTEMHIAGLLPVQRVDRRT